MTDTETLVAAMQFGDGQFPSGGFAFSWGLETLVSEGLIRREGLGAFIASQLEHRWGTFDRVILVLAHRAIDEAELADLDDWVDAFTLAEAQRTGSKRAGRALLDTHARLETPGAASYRARVIAGRGTGHLPVAQGIVLRGAGLSEGAASAVAAYSVVSGFGTAAIRLGLASHLDIQRIMSALRSPIAALVDAPVASRADVSSFVPLSDIALMRHPTRPLRLFSN